MLTTYIRLHDRIFESNIMFSYQEHKSLRSSVRDALDSLKPLALIPTCNTQNIYTLTRVKVRSQLGFITKTLSKDYAEAPKIFTKVI